MLYIQTLGSFDIRDSEDSLITESSRKYRLYKLFQYFITFRNKRLLPDTIVDNLFQDNESMDPKNVLRSQIFRLRQLIQTFIPEGEDEANYLNISFVNGYYSLEIGEKTVLDIELFEDLINQNKYKEALSLYEGIYLSEQLNEIWVVPTKNYYRRLYVNTLFKFIEILIEQNRNEEIIETCESAITLEPHEEAIHIYLIEAMLRKGQINSAQSHYEFAMSMIEKELGTKACIRLKEVQRRIQSRFIDNERLDIYTLEYKLENESSKGALQCDLDYFKFLFNVQKRKADRSQTFDYICLITLMGFSKCTEETTEALKNSLRVGDVFTIWNDTQIPVLLHDVKDEGLRIIEDRIRIKLKEIPLLKVNIRFLPINSEEFNF